jgi:hypothetical protein
MKCAILDTDVGTDVDDALALALIAFPKCYDNRYRAEQWAKFVEHPVHNIGWIELSGSLDSGRSESFAGEGLRSRDEREEARAVVAWAILTPLWHHRERNTAQRRARLRK